MCRERVRGVQSQPMSANGGQWLATPRGSGRSSTAAHSGEGKVPGQPMQTLANRAAFDKRGFPWAYAGGSSIQWRLSQPPLLDDAPCQVIRVAGVDMVA
jgi:hypothetical protein